MSEPLLVLGASARAAACSARRAGFLPIAADLFADMDLAEIASVTKVARFPADLFRAAQSAPSCEWMYVGCLENHARLVDRIASTRPLLGNPGRVLRAVRDPLNVADCLRQADLPTPAVSRSSADARAGQWLQKPLLSCGGGKIAVVGTYDQISFADVGARAWYYQQRIEGTPCSVVFVADGQSAVCLGATEQLIGGAGTAVDGFRYAGSIGPLELSTSEWSTLERIGQCLARRFGLVGLFGVDLIGANGSFWPVEVNPRFTASIEILERACSLNAVSLQVAACRELDLPHNPPRAPTQLWGKAIVYARKSIIVSQTFVDSVREVNCASTWPLVADIPRPDTTIQAEWPVTTVFASGSTIENVRQQLQIETQRIQSLLKC